VNSARLNLFATAAAAMLLTLIAGCQRGDSSTPGTKPSNPAPRFSDGMLRLDRAPGEKGFWDSPSASGLVEAGANVEMDERGKLKNPADASKVAPFQPWALALYQHRQANDFADDPMKDCIGPGNPRQMHTPGGIRIIQDRNYNRVYVLFGGGNRGWRVIYLDGREPPNPDEVTATFYGLAVGKWGRSAPYRGAASDGALLAHLARRARVRSDDRRSAHIHAPLEEQVDPSLGAGRYHRAVL
jgi:hypothetical protein